MSEWMREWSEWIVNNRESRCVSGGVNNWASWWMSGQWRLCEWAREWMRVGGLETVW